MTKLIGIKELQTNTKQVRKEVANGTNFIVIYRSKPVFEIRPVSEKLEFTNSMESTGSYTEDFIKRMKKVEQDLHNGNTKAYTTGEA